MKPNSLEKTLIEKMLADPEVNPIKHTVNFDSVIVIERRFTGVGFFTDFQYSPETKLFDSSVSLRWGKVVARLNESKLETGYLVYVDDGYLTTIEGYTYGEDWPEQVEKIEWYARDFANKQ